VGLIHMNGRVHDPLLARFGTPDPMTENPFSAQGWNRYSYVGNSPVNFADPTGYCLPGLRDLSCAGSPDCPGFACGMDANHVKDIRYRLSRPA
jgi:hypothetical protein